MKQVSSVGRVPLVKLFLFGLGAITFGIYGYYLILSLYPQQPAVETAVWVQVAAPELKLRQEPADEARAVKSMKLGDQLQVLGEKENWLNVRDEQGNSGWVSRLYIVLSPPGLQ